MSAEPASRVTDGFGHSHALTGALVGLAVGVGVGLFIIGTGGLGAIAVGAAIGVAGGAGLAGEAIGSTMPGPVTGNIQTGSPNVVVNNLPMAAVQIGAGPCSHHSGTRLVASGAASVLVNGQPAARIRELMTCSAAIRTGSPNVVIGGPSKQVLQTAPEVPRLLHNTMLAMAVGGAIIGTGGIAATYGTGAAVGSVVGGIGGGMLGSAGARQGAAALGFGATGQEVAAQLGGFAGGALFGGMGMRGGQAAQARIPAGKFGFLLGPKTVGATEPGAAPITPAPSAATAADAAGLHGPTLPGPPGAPGGAAKGIGSADDLGIPKNLSSRQSLHIPPVTDGRSVLTANPSDLLQGLHDGQFTILRQPKPGQVVVDFGKPIGEYWSNGARVGETRFGSVSYGKKGAHIIPANPNQW